MNLSSPRACVACLMSHFVRCICPRLLSTLSCLSQSAAFAPTKLKQQDSASDPVSPSAPSATSTEGSVDQSLQAITDDIAQSMDADIERKREQAAQAAWGGQAPSASDAATSPDLSGSNGGGNTKADGEGAGSSVDSGNRKSALDELSLDDLQAELERREQASSNA